MSTTNGTFTVWDLVWGPVLHELPMDPSIKSLPPSIQEVSQEIVSQARAIVKKYDILIEDEDIDFSMRRPYEEIPTLRILSTWSPDKKEAWEKAVQEMAVFLTEFFKDSPVKKHDIHVEIMSRELQGPIYYGPVNDPALSAAWTASAMQGSRSTRYYIRKGLEASYYITTGRIMAPVDDHFQGLKCEDQAGASAECLRNLIISSVYSLYNNVSKENVAMPLIVPSLFIPNPLITL
ncbi:hypothetical protein F53441_5408 [Fusarium austroafricanum]|uniref:Uncharacterized protein n=1 Tax=Fusarium austroafricanum TaxID=2364996 RepID=A0A8H4KL96_9HYPO|nr:hypothetical protein F53441_5408 [Fusarium austroafricanum]